MSASTLSTCAWIDTSSAATDSSRMSTRGSVASARAIATRWRCPPESALGSALIWRWSRPTSSASSPTMRLRSAASWSWWTRRTSSMSCGAGLARVEAGVRVLEDDLHLAAARLRSLPRRAGLDRSRPQAVMVPAVGFSRPQIMRATVVLPLPDSPTMASDRPAMRSNVMSSTATWVPNTLRRLRTDSTAWASSRVARVAGPRTSSDMGTVQEPAAQVMRPAGSAPTRRRARSGPARRCGRRPRRAGSAARTGSPTAPRTPTPADRGSRRAARPWR